MTPLGWEMTLSIEIALSLLAAAIPVTALVLRFASMVTPVQFVKLETEFIAFRGEVRRDLTEIKSHLERL